MRTLFLTLAFSLASFSNAMKLDVLDLDVQPHVPRALLNLTADFGFPMGEQAFLLTFDCRRGTTDVSAYADPSALGSVTGEFFGSASDLVKNPEAVRALFASKLVSAKPGAVTVKGTEGGTLSLRCEQGVLKADFSKAKQIGNEFDPKYRYDTFTDDPDSLVTHVTIASANTGDPYNATEASTYAWVERAGKGWRVRAVTLDTGLEGKDPRAFVSDGKALYPIYYKNAYQDNAALKNLMIGDKLEVYFSPNAGDGASWRKAVLDFGRRVFYSVPAKKPAGPIKQ